LYSNLVGYVVGFSLKNILDWNYLELMENILNIYMVFRQGIYCSVKHNMFNTAIYNIYLLGVRNLVDTAYKINIIFYIFYFICRIIKNIKYIFYFIFFKYYYCKCSFELLFFFRYKYFIICYLDFNFIKGFFNLNFMNLYSFYIVYKFKYLYYVKEHVFYII